MVIVLVAALIGATMVGFAAATTAGVIYACVNNSSGTIHIVSATTTCTSNEVALSWNTEGPPGATGAAGPVGLTGATGSSGAAGAPGILGLEFRTQTYSIGGGEAGLIVWVNCPYPKVAIAGGFDTDQSGGHLRIWSSHPADVFRPTSSWAVTVTNDSPFTVPITVHVTCAFVS
jgi:hypothetical protein